MIREEKAALRRLIRDERRHLPPGYPSEAGRAAARLLLASPLWRTEAVMAYAAIRGEMDMSTILEAALAQGKTLLMPRCEESGSLSARRVRTLQDLQPGMRGIPEPGDHCVAAEPGMRGIMLIPGLSYDRTGLRLGQGGGYYDRFLPLSPMIRIGVCYASEVRERVPAEPFDAAVQYILTEDSLLCVRGET